MALSAQTIWDASSTGSDTNGGGFVAGASGTDWSQQDSPQYSVTDGVTAGTTTIISATAAFGTDVVGNIIYVQGGTGSVAAARYQIASRTNATTIVVDRSTGLTAGTGVTLKIGGRLANLMTAPFISGNAVFLKGAQTALTGTVKSISTSIAIIGYTATRGDGGYATFSASGMTAGNNAFNFSNVAALNLKVSSAKSASFSGGANYFNCYSDTPGTKGFDTVGWVIRCIAKGGGDWGIYFPTGNIVGSVASGQTANGGIAASSGVIGCLVSGVTGVGIDTSSGFQRGPIHGCTVYNSSSHGFSLTDYQSITNSVAYGNGGFGFVNAGGTNDYNTFGPTNCAAGSNTSGASSGYNTNVSGLFPAITSITADPFANKAGAWTTLQDIFSNFAPNTTSGGGTILRALGFPLYADIGSTQHQDTGGGSSGMLYIPGMSGGMEA